MKTKDKNGLRPMLGIAMAIIIVVSCNKEPLTDPLTENSKGNILQLDQKLRDSDRMLASYTSRFTSNSAHSKRMIESIQKGVNQIFLRSANLKKAMASSADLEPTNLKRRPIGQEVIRVPLDFSNLQEAIDNARPGTKILVQGVLKNQGEITVSVPNLKIIGAQDDIHWKKDDDDDSKNDLDKSVIKGTSIHLMAENIEISHLTLKINVVISSGASGAKVLHNKFKSDLGAAEETASGILLMKDVSDCSIMNNTIKIKSVNTNGDDDNFSYGIYAAGCSGNYFKHNTIIGSDNTLAHMFLKNSVNNKIINSTIRNGGNGIGAGIYLVDGYHGNLISGCVVKNLNTSGIFLNNLNSSGDNNRIVNCSVKNYRGERLDGQGNLVSYGIRIENGDSNVIRNCKVTGSGPRSILDEGIGIIFAENSTIEGCISSRNSGGGITIFSNGGDNKIKNCRASQNGGNLSAGSLSSFGILYFGFFESNGSALIEKCIANNNMDLNTIGAQQGFPGAIQVVDIGGDIKYTITNCKAINNIGVTSIPEEIRGMGILAFVLPELATGRAQWLLENNISRKNNYGIGLFNSVNATLSKNGAKRNTICDYQEVNSSGTILVANLFGTTCD